MASLEVEELAAQIQGTLDHIKSGSLRFWGVWFGRPYDNIHTIVRADAEGNCLRLEFQNGEVLQVWRVIGIGLLSPAQR